MTANSVKQRSRVETWARLAVLVAGVVLVALFVVHFRYRAWDLRNNLWAPAHLLLQGDTPYDLQALDRLSSEWGVPFHLSIWFPTILGVGLPLGALPWPQAANIWLILSLIASLVAAGLMHGISRPADSPRTLLPLALILVPFAPMYTHVWLGQASLVVLASLVAGWVLLKHGHPGWAGLVLSLSWVKPQLMLFAWPLLAWWAIETGQWRPALAGWLAGTGAQTIPLWILDPTWPAGYLGALRANPAWLQPNLQGLVAYWSGSQPLSWGVTLLAVVAAAIWLARMWRRGCRLGVFTWTLALTTVLSPYTWSYDQVLLLPFLLVTVYLIKPGWRSTLFWIIFFACQVIYVMLRLWVPPDEWYAWFPPLFMVLGAWLTWGPDGPRCPADE